MHQAEVDLCLANKLMYMLEVQLDPDQTIELEDGDQTVPSFNLHVLDLYSYRC